MEHNFDFLRVQATTPHDVASINNLLQHLRAGIRPITQKHVEELLNESSVIAVARDQAGTIVGMGTLIVYHKLSKGVVGLIEDVVVDSSHQKKGVATMLMRQLIDVAKARGLASIRLTSNNERSDAHRLYKKLGFRIVDTNVFGIIFR